MEGLQRCKAKFRVDLHPSKLANVSAGVRAHLNSLLLRYNDDLDGILLSYTKCRMLTQQAAIHPYFPFVRVEVVADVVLFRPSRGMRLVGTVNKVGADYVGLLLLGFINVSIAADQIRTEFRARPMEQCWVSSKSVQHRIEVGTLVHFTVHAVQHNGQFVSIAGSLQQPGTGAEGFTALSSARAKERRQQQQQGQQAGQQHQRKAEGKQKKRKSKVAEQGRLQTQAIAQPQANQQQQQADQGGGRKAKKSKQQGAGDRQPHAQPQQQQQAGAAEDAGKSGKKKGKMKRKAEEPVAADGPAPKEAAGHAASNGSMEQPKKKKKKTKV